MPPEPRARPGHWWRIAGGFAFSIALFFVLGEIVVRALDLVDRLNVYPRDLYIATPNPDMPYRLRPGFVHEHADGRFSLRINAKGLRGAEIPDTAEAGTTRILILGDSVVHGHLIAEPDTFPVRLAEALPDQKRTEVINAGVSGYNTAAELAFFENHLQGLQPDVVLLGVSLNDFSPTPVLTARGNLSQNPALRDGLPLLTNHSDFYLLLRWLLEGGGPRPGPMLRPESTTATPVAAPEATEKKGRREPGKMDQWVAEKHQNFYREPTGPGWESVQRALEGFAARAREDGFPLLVLLFPEEYQVGTTTPNLRAQEHWLALCRASGLDCLDLQPAFQEAAEKTPEPLFGDAQHPNTLGIEVMAEAVARALEARGLVPVGDAPNSAS